MPNRLYLCIGMPKCGTTAVENYLFDNRDNLNGFVYPCLTTSQSERIEGNGYDLAILVDEKDDNSDELKIMIEKIKNELNKGPLILMSERFYQIDLDALMQIMVSEFDEIYVVCYLRRQDLYIESTWNQGVKQGDFWWSHLSFEEYIDVLHVFEEGNYLNKLDIIEKYIKDKKRIIIRPYEKEQLYEGDSIKDFLHIMGIEYIPYALDDKYKNKRLNGYSLDLKRFINGITMDRDMQWKLFFHFGSERRGDESCKESYLSEKRREEIMDMFDDHNRVIARNYLNRESLFSQIGGEAPLHQEEEFSKQLLNEMRIMLHDLTREKEIEHKKLLDELCNRQEHIKSLENSISWKITSPLRYIDKTIRRR